MQLLNQYYKDDTAARIAVFRQSNWNVQEQLCAGYLNETDFIKAEKEILTILQTLPKLKPFSSLDIAAEKQRIAELFTEGNAAALSDYLRRRAATAQFDGVFPPEYNKALLKTGETMCATVLSTLHFYDAIPEDMRKALNSSRNSLPVWMKPTDLTNTTCCPLQRRYSGRIHFPCTRNTLLSRNGETVVFSSPPEEWPLRAITALC